MKVKGFSVPLDKTPQFIREESGTPPDVRLRKFLQRYDAPCPQCGYNLRGVAADCCPECGAPLNAEVMWPDRFRHMLYVAAGLYMAAAGILFMVAVHALVDWVTRPGPVRWHAAAGSGAPLLLSLLNGFLAWTLLRRVGRERFKAAGGDRRATVVVTALLVVLVTVAAGMLIGGIF